ncbi:hypothetical protein [Conexibacter sp. SYSU D00693]|uniref:hypothetical protein n=1 Tax=Conexibacter sp. SYSU D00693 TaxID=2812560 RepID=UPI00196ADA51|nr:hypothetical protein [Conexibacter sp. SYSU D00693]
MTNSTPHHDYSAIAARLSGDEAAVAYSALDDDGRNWFVVERAGRRSAAMLPRGEIDTLDASSLEGLIRAGLRRIETAEGTELVPADLRTSPVLQLRDAWRARSDDPQAQVEILDAPAAAWEYIGEPAIDLRFVSPQRAQSHAARLSWRAEVLVAPDAGEFDEIAAAALRQFEQAT